MKPIAVVLSMLIIVVAVAALLLSTHLGTKLWFGAAVVIAVLAVGAGVALKSTR